MKFVITPPYFKVEIVVRPQHFRVELVFGIIDLTFADVGHHQASKIFLAKTNKEGFSKNSHFKLTCKYP